MPLRHVSGVHTVVAGRLATPGRIFLVTAVVTAVVAFTGGMLAEPVLHRWRHAPAGWSGRVGDLAPPAIVALRERPSGRPDGHPAAPGDAGESDDLGH
jgi:hypothetical protein